MQKRKALDKSNVQDIIPLTSVQQGMLYYYLSDKNSKAYHMQFSVMLKGSLDKEAIEKAWNHVIKQNEALRSVFRWENLSNPVQVILKEHSLDMKYFDLSSDEDLEEYTRISEELQAFREKNLDLEEVAFRVALIKLKEKEFRMDVISHHILYDGWSSGILIKEFMESYQAIVNNDFIEIKTKTGLKTYIKQLQGQDNQNSLEFWKQYLKDNSVITSFEPCCGWDEEKNEEGVVSLRISEQLQQQLNDYTKGHNVTVASLFYCAWGVLLAKYNDSRDVIFGTTVSGRSANVPDMVNMAGMFINTIPMRFRYPDSISVHDMIKQMNQDIIQRSEWEQVPLIEITKCLDNKLAGDLFDTIVVVENYPFDHCALTSQNLVVDDILVNEKSHYNIELCIRIGKNIDFIIKYNDEMYSEMTVRFILQQYTLILEKIMAQPNCLLRELFESFQEAGGISGTGLMDNQCVGFSENAQRGRNILQVVKDNSLRMEKEGKLSLECLERISRSVEQMMAKDEEYHTVAVHMRNAVDLVRLCNLSKEDRMLVLLNNTGEHILMELMSAELAQVPVSFSEKEQFQPELICKQIYKNKASVVFFTSDTIEVFLQYILEYDIDSMLVSLKKVVVTGHFLQGHVVQQLKMLKEKYPCVQCVNIVESKKDGYLVSFDLDDCELIDGFVVCRQLQNGTVTILAQNAQAQPVGATGELYVLSPSMKSDEENPSEQSDLTGQCYDGTGEYVKALSDGSLMLIEHESKRVLIRNKQISLQAIEEQIYQVTGVTICRCCFVKGKLTILLRVAPDADKKQIDRMVRTVLPKSVKGIDSEICFVEQFPVTKDGKLFIEDLLEETDGVQKGGKDALLTDVEVKVMEIWKEVLGIENVNTKQNFFDIGGDSFKIMKVHDKIKSSFQVQFDIVELFKYTNIHEIAMFLSDSTETEVERKEKKEKKPKPVSHTERKVHDTDVAVIGMAGRFPGADNIQEYWNNIVNGVESIRFYTDDELIESGIPEELVKSEHYVKAKGELKGAQNFDAAFFDILPREAQIMDPQLRLLYECTWEALEDAGCCVEQYSGQTGIYVAASSNYFWIKNLDSSESQDIDIYKNMLATERDFFATRLAYKLNAHGPAVTIQTACSSSLVTVTQAYSDLLNHKCDLAVAGGVGLTYPYVSGYGYEEGMIFSPDGHCRAFDAEANGTVPGNGVGIVILKRLKDAIQDKDEILAVIKSAEINNDGNEKVGYTAPGISGQERVLRKAINKAGVRPEDITYIETHGTGTPLGDRVELQALCNVHGGSDVKCAIGSVKTNIGHLDAASGIAGFIKTVLQIKNKTLVPSLHYEKENEAFQKPDNRFYVNTKTVNWDSQKPLCAGVSSFGMGGTNAHVILEEMITEEPAKELANKIEDKWNVCCFSANSISQLDRYMKSMKEFVGANQQISLDDFSGSLHTCRTDMKYRTAIVTKSMKDLYDQMGDYNVSVENTEHQDIVFMFPGQGLQYRQMGKKLYTEVPLFKEEVDHCFQMLHPKVADDLKKIWLGDQERDDLSLNNTSISQPVLFIFEYALASVLRKTGVTPSAMIGHSIGEYVAACISGVFSLRDALNLVVERGRLMEQTPESAMLSVNLSETEIYELFDESVTISVINGEHYCVISGDISEIEEMKETCDSLGIKATILHTRHAFHSEFMDGILEEYESFVEQTDRRAHSIPYLSNVTGDWITDSEVKSKEYWSQHLRGTVRFEEGIRRLLQKDNTIFIEVGPGDALCSFVTLHKSKNSTHSVMQLVRRHNDATNDCKILLHTLSSLWQKGCQIQWNALYKQEDLHKLRLPVHTFDSIRIENPKPNLNTRLRTEQMVKGTRDVSDWYYVPSWRVISKPDVDVWPVKKHILVFTLENDIASHVIEKLKARNDEVICVSIGTEYKRVHEQSYCINPSNRNDYVQLFDDLCKQDVQIDTVLHMWLTSVPVVTGYEKKEQILDQGLYSMIYTTQEYTKHYKEKLDIFVISNGMHRVLSSDETNPLYATMLGFIKICPVEYKNITCKGIDVLQEEMEMEQERIEEVLFGEIMCPENQVVALRQGQKYIQEYKQVIIPGIPQCLKVLGERGVYLVTGGLSGIGFELFQKLASKEKAHFILLGRTRFPERCQWDSCLLEDEFSQAQKKKIQIVKQVEASGSTVSVYSADIADYETVKRIVEEEEKEHGSVTGVIHAAGVSDYNGIIQHRTKEEMEKILRAKVDGTIVLNRIFASYRLDFFVLCSSIGNIASYYKFGQVAYNAANEFLDAYADNCAQKGMHVMSINWSDWNETGMSIDSSKRWEMILNKKNIEIPEDGITNEEGKEVFYRLLQYQVNRVAISNIELGTKVEKGKSILEQLLWDKDEKESDREMQYGQNEIEEKLKDIWKKTMGIEIMNSTETFINMGASSLDMLQVFAHIKNVFGVEISISDMYTYPTIGSLASHIFHIQGGQ